MTLVARRSQDLGGRAGRGAEPEHWAGPAVCSALCLSRLCPGRLPCDRPERPADDPTAAHAAGVIGGLSPCGAGQVPDCAEASLSLSPSWPCVSRPPTPRRRGRRGGYTTA